MAKTYLTSEEVLVLSALPPFSSKGVTIDVLPHFTGLTIAECQSALVTLELKGKVQRLPGNMFRRQSED